MAENLDDGEFWLPPQILVDDDIDTSGFKSKKSDEFEALSPKALFPSEFPYAFESYGVPSDLSSPVESVTGSSETETDEEERVVDLTPRMARSTLELDFASGKPKEMFGSGSPKSTLCAFGKGSSDGSPNSGGQLSSQKATWDLLHAAAGEVEKMKLGEEACRFNHRQGMLGLYPVTSPVKNSDPPDVGLYTQQLLSHQQLQILQFQMLRQQQMMKLQNSAGFYQQRRSNQRAPIRGRNSEISGPRNVHPADFASPAWPPLQQPNVQTQIQQYGSGMRAVFLDNSSGKKRECAGTGVFLPRRVDSPSESRRKPACSTVLVPARVAQALNLKLDENMVGGHPQDQSRFNGVPKMDNEAAFPKLRRNQGLPQHKRSFRPPPPPPPANHHDLRLPQDWTY